MTKEELTELITSYSVNKKEQDHYKRIVDAGNLQIKNAMSEMGVDEFDTGELTAKVTVTRRESFDEEKLINTLNNLTYKDETTGTANICVATGLNIVKMRPYVDMDALEEAIYSGKITDEHLLEIGKCKDTKEVVTLRVSKTKKNKEED